MVKFCRLLRWMFMALPEHSATLRGCFQRVRFTDDGCFTVEVAADHNSKFPGLVLYLRIRRFGDDLTKVGRLRYLPFSTASIITSNDNTAPYLFNPTDCSQIWAPSRKPFSCSHAEAGTGASWSGTHCFL
jgi:hypothetical protein